MRQYVERILTEKKDLEGKIKRAKKAVESNLYDMDKTQKLLLAEQIKYMERYLDMLNQRIEYELVEKGK